MQDLQNLIPQIWSTKTIKLFFDKTIYRAVTNTDYEGEIKEAGDTVIVRTLENIDMKDYTKGMTLVPQELNPTKETMVIDQMKYQNFRVDDVDVKQGNIDAITKYAERASDSASEYIDQDVLDYATKNLHGDNVLGGEYSDGTVEVADTTGVVTGTGTTFTEEMVGGYFKADGHTEYYLVTGFTDATHITISDLGGSTYSGGAISAGASYVIKGATAITLDKDNIYSYLVQLGVKLSNKKAPKKDRFIVVNPEFEGVVRLSPQFTSAVEPAYNEVIKNGLIGKIAGFDVYVTTLVPGNETDGYMFWAGTKGYMSFAMQILKSDFIPSSSDPHSFMSTFKALFVWGRKVFNGYRGLGAGVRAKLSFN